MSSPTSHNEASRVANGGGLREKPQAANRPPAGGGSSANYSEPLETHSLHDAINEPLDYTMESLLLDTQIQNGPPSNCNDSEYLSAKKSTHMSVSSEPVSNLRSASSLYHGTWPVERSMWNSEPTSLGPVQQAINHAMDVTSVMSFASSSAGVPLDRVFDSPDSRRSSQQFEAKVDMVYNLLAVLGGQEHADMGETLLALSANPESCLAMRQSGCIPVLVQLVQSERDVETIKKASEALQNLIQSQPDEKIRKRETKILKLLDQARAYTLALISDEEYQPDPPVEVGEDKHPVQTIAHVMKLSFDEGHRQAICQLGGIHSIANIVEVEHLKHGSTTSESQCILMRRYACMALTNLTFGDSGNKALLCSYKDFMRALVVQLQSPSDELRQVTASVLRNLSWRADSTSKEILKEVGCVRGLITASMLNNKENTLKSILSALWNLSAHCTENKADICAVEGALEFLVKMLTYTTQSKSLAIRENSGGILRNISSQIAVRDDYREILRKNNCLQVLLDQLKSPSLTIVSNACGTLWNLSAKCPADQETLWQMGAPAMLRSLNHSKHKMIAMGSSAALKNLLSARPQQTVIAPIDSTALSLDLPVLPTLGARKQKALLHDLDNNLSETYENIEKDSPVKMNEKNDFLQKPKREPTKTEDDGLNASFASLNLNEPSTSHTTEVRKSKIPLSFGSTSLPYMQPPKRLTAPCTFIPVRNKFSDVAYEDENEASDQPIDYSQKYSETKLPSNVNKTESSKPDKFVQPKKDDESFGMYAETDLDQPTDYSLRYAEDDFESDLCPNKVKTEATNFVQDTVKTYCTEDTPYETPFNFSTATSMSDLRNLDEKPVIDNDKSVETAPKSKEVKIEDEKEHCSTEDISEIDNTPPKQPVEGKIPKSELSSGLMSPEKPTYYCEEGTPGCFSRVSSFGSLNSIPANETVIKNEVKEEVNISVEEAETENKENLMEKTPQKVSAEAKAVKFEQVVNYAEQTPLMFSRSSSLASLDSIEQHSIHDDRSSVVSDFSRLTSGIVSPSELPDSPTQTVPPSPKPRKLPLEFPSTSKRSLEGRPQPAPRSIAKPSVFEDNFTKFKEESTPVQFSTATSLSSLTIDDHDEIESQTLEDRAISNNISPIKEEQSEKQDNEKDLSLDFVNDESASVQESEEEGDEDLLLADCINIGMQTSRHNQNKSPALSSASSKLPLSVISNKFAKSHSSIPLPKSSPRSVPPSNINSHANSFDTLQTYCTEDTPAILSHAGSNSDLSTLSIPNDNKSKKDYLSDDSSNLSGDNDNILAECIQSGMPKANKLNKSIASCLPRRNVVQTSTPIKTTASNKTNEGGNNVNTRRDRKIEANKGQNRDSKSRDLSLPPYFTAKDEFENYGVENSPCHYSLRSSLSDLTVDGSVAGLKRYVPATNEFQSNGDSPSASGLRNQEVLNISQEHNTSQKSRRESLSSISVESFGSLEAEQALLEQCISSGMPKGTNCNSQSKPLNMPSMQNAVKPVAAKQFARSSSKENRREEEEEDFNDSKSKNAHVASVAANTIVMSNVVFPDMSPAGAGVEENQKQEKGTERTGNYGTGKTGNYAPDNQPKKIDTQPDTLRDKCLLTDENLLTDVTKSGSNKSDSSSDYADDIDSCLDRSCENSGKIVDNRMLDPDAMIESLDRFTAELVSQASHLNKEDDKYKVSTNDNTWNDDSSPNELTFPSISGSVPNVITFKSDEEASSKVQDEIDGNCFEPEQKSNDFSSINTSTMTESTLIAMEATRMATVFKNEADMSQSISSIASLELDHVQPPSSMGSLNNSGVGVDRFFPKSPKLVARKKSLPLSGLMIRRALNNSLHHGSSIESLENNSLSNLDHMNPPSEIKDVFDMEGSMTSVASLPREDSVKADFLINGVVSKDLLNDQNPIFNVKQPPHYLGNSISNLDQVNPPSLFNDITDMCNSLADVNTETIGTETEIFEDCFTHVGDSTLQDDPTEFSDANSITPIQSDFNSSSNESTPKKTKSLSKSMNSKQKRRMASDRYKTYTIAADMIMRQEQEVEQNSTLTEDYNTAANMTPVCQDLEDDTTYVSPTYSVDSEHKKKLTAKERRRANKSRYETQVLDMAITNVLKHPIVEPVQRELPSLESDSNNSSANPSPVRSKLSIRRNFMQKRLENKDRFKTQTLTESSFSPEILSGDIDFSMLVQQEANLVLKTLSETKTSNYDDLLDCETISLVSNDDDSEQNSGGSMNYRTYHKSWGSRKNNIPVIPSNLTQEPKDLVNCHVSNLNNDHQSLPDDNNVSDHSDLSDDEQKPVGKPKIVKPSERKIMEIVVENNEPKGIRGRRKPLFSKSNFNSKVATKSIKPIKTMTSNLVKNVTSTFKSGTNLKSIASKQNKTLISKPPVSQSKVVSSGYGSRPVSNSNSPKTSPARSLRNLSPKPPITRQESKESPTLERQGTFTKPENTPKSKIPAPASKIPSFSSKIARAVAPNNTKLPMTNKVSATNYRNGIKSASSERPVRSSKIIYNRSTSAESRDTMNVRKIQTSNSTQSLKGDTTKNGAVKKASTLPQAAQKSNSNVSLNSNGSGKKQVTSKIASLWKKIEESKNKAPKKDNRVWIQAETNNAEPPRLIRSNTFDNKDQVVLRNKPDGEENVSPTKRVSRLGSFIVMDENEDGVRIQQAICAASTV